MDALLHNPSCAVAKRAVLVKLNVLRRKLVALPVQLDAAVVGDFHATGAVLNCTVLRYLPRHADGFFGIHLLNCELQFFGRHFRYSYYFLFL